MSLVNSNGGGGGYGGLAVQAPLRAMPGPQFQAQAPQGASVARLPSALGGGGNGADDMRGELTGDSCLTVSLDSDGYHVATWDEKAAECVVHDKVSSKGSTADVAQILRDVVSSNASVSTVPTAAVPAAETDTKKKKKARAALALGEGGVTIVVANAASQKVLRQVVVEVHAAGFKVKNIFRRGIATVTGMLSRQALSQKELAKTSMTPSADPVVFYVSSVKRSDGGAIIDASLVVCEGGERAKGKLGFERMCTLAVGSKTLSSSPSAEVDEVKALFDTLISRANIDVSSISAIVCDGNDLQLPVTKLLPAEKKVPILSGGQFDAVSGGCMLSAAELGSSKNYLHQTDGNWILAFLLPVADGYLADDVGLQTASDKGDKVVEPLFSPRRLWKGDIGPLKPGALKHVTSTVTKKYVHTERKRGLLSRLWPSGVDAGAQAVAPGFCIALVERATNCGSDEWVPIGGKDVRPLQRDGLEVVGSTLHIQIDPATGLVAYTDSKGKSLAEVNSDFWWWAQVVASILALVLLVASYFLYGHFYEWYLSRQHTAWLVGFYQKHAPEKLKDIDYVSRTIKKYKGKMFLLWRGLERTYSTKYPAPPSVLENGGDL